MDKMIVVQRNGCVYFYKDKEALARAIKYEANPAGKPVASNGACFRFSEKVGFLPAEVLDEGGASAEAAT